MATYLSLEEAAQKLGIPTDRLVELRNEGQVRGFRDGTSWKFQDTDIDRLADELGDDLGGSGLLVSEQEVGAPLSESSGNIIGGDAGSEEGSGSDLELGSESLKPGSEGSDVNLVPTDGNGSDVAIVTSDSDSGSDLSLADESDLMLDASPGDVGELDSAMLQLDEPAMTHDSTPGLAAEPDAGSAAAEEPASESGSVLELGVDSGEVKLSPSSDLSFAGAPGEEESDELVLGGSSMEVLDGESGGSQPGASGASSLELMEELDSPASGGSAAGASPGSPAGDVLSELDILGGEQGSGLELAADSQDVLSSSSGLGSSIGADDLGDDSLSGIDDAISDDDDLVIADDDDDLIISSAGSDLSVAGDSGINLMSPSDSGLSLESEPLDLAGSSISALDLGAEVPEEGGSDGSGRDEGSGSAVDFQADEEFQLSPSGVGLEADFESGSQVIDVEDSEAIAEPVDFGAAAVGDEVFAADDAGAAEPEALGFEEEGVVALEDTRAASVPAAAAAVGGYEVPFTLLQVLTLMLIIGVLSVGGMLMTDLVRNMWTYSEPAAPVSSLTDSLITLMGWD